MLTYVGIYVYKYVEMLINVKKYLPINHFFISPLSCALWIVRSVDRDNERTKLMFIYL